MRILPGADAPAAADKPSSAPAGDTAPVGDEAVESQDNSGQSKIDAVGTASASQVAAAEVATVGDVLVAIEELWPASLAEGWDAVGPVVGRPERPVKRIIFAVDPTLDVIRDAVSRQADMLITHHPLLLRPVNGVAATGFKGEAIHLLIESGCALVTAHTNADSAVGGVSDVLADILGLTDIAPLAASAAGLPEEGIGRVGYLESPLTLGDFAARVFGAMPAVAGGVRVAGDREGLVHKVAVCGGAGDSLFDQVRAAEADVYVTADLRHHPASEAREAAVNGRPYLIDVSHFGSEWLWLPAAAAALDNVLRDQDFEVEIGVSGINTDPWDFVLTPGA
ncbi:Nif3-like dinuclear metal center hexameric protein [Paeniglutamicibacter cryotolerans]|uniref:GTP cyclohydrolase 1 type 2 homolog n=1 Tax=Paeniglutamicibacter cryotolerans TaxID=670079 RepID=A0A839QLN7_9MICC|nr:Nif3-like dinuclear metal center hexameric protein [Paeniglutamicibacter cryotolerans]MBB2997338.1 dinuclear metal center YbgI/SA1388 family protein [Paeniglutamicibacter cryotolerans]